MLKEELFKTEALTYDEIIIHPGYIDFDVNEVSLKTKLTKNIELNIPILSSPMDTVTESEMAIQLALQGGMGILHCNNTIEEQVNMLKKVKRYRNGFIDNVITMRPHDTIEELLNYDITAFPITENNKLVGIVTKRDFDFIEDKNALQPLDTAIQSNLSESTTKILASLTPREERVLRMRFGVGMNTDHTLEEVGLQFSVTRERIRQIEAKALRKLKHPIRSKKLKSFMDS